MTRRPLLFDREASLRLGDITSLSPEDPKPEVSVAAVDNPEELCENPLLCSDPADDSFRRRRSLFFGRELEALRRLGWGDFGSSSHAAAMLFPADPWRRYRRARPEEKLLERWSSVVSLLLFGSSLSESSLEKDRPLRGRLPEPLRSRLPVT